MLNLQNSMDHKQKLINYDSGHILPFLVILFIGSGCAALIYEVIWLQMLQLVIGLTSVSLGILLGTFMGGMCLGSLFLSRIISMKHHPLRIYAVLEICIGLMGLLLLYGFPLIEKIYAGMAGSDIFGSILLRSSIVIICLLPPTIFMGATLPAISRWVETTPRGVSWMGFFYGGNIFGGVLGCLLSGFYLLRKFDIEVATYVAFCINLAIALVALFISRITSGNYNSTLNDSQTANSRGLKLVYITIALSGMAALGSEVIWTRLLSTMMGSTVYTFSIILAAFLVGLGTGSGAGALLSRYTKNPGLFLGLFQLLLIGAIAWASYIIAWVIPYRSQDLTMMVNPWYQFWNDIGFSALAVIPPAILWGASFPMALAVVAAKGQDPGRIIGGLYASNTVGAIIGSFTFSMIGFNILGSEVSQQFLVIIAGVAAIIMFYLAFKMHNSKNAISLKRVFSAGNLRLAAITATVILLVVFVAGKISTIPWVAVAYGKYISNNPDIEPGKSSDGQTESPTKLLYLGEGLNESVAVTELSNGVRQFHSVGKVQASTDWQDMRLQRMLGHFAGLLTDKPESVLVIGCGAGITAGTFITYPEVRQIVVCDIESMVPEFVAPFFSKENNAIADGIISENPHEVNGKQVRFEFDDGRHFLTTSNEKYDIITTDPIDPCVKGAAALYTREFFNICKAHLNPGGTITVWIPLYQNSRESVRSMVKTFSQVFPDAILWSNDKFGEGYDMVLFGQNGTTSIGIEKLEDKLLREDYDMVRRSLAYVNLMYTEDLLGTYAGRASDLKEWMFEAEINTDRNMRLSYLSGESIYYFAATDIFLDIIKYYKFPEDLFTGSDQKLDLLKLRIKEKMWMIMN